MQFLQGSWIRQPTTMVGGAVLVCTALLTVFGFIPVSVFVCFLAPAAGLLFLDDNTSKDAQTLMLDTVTAVTTKHLADNLPVLLKDAMAVATDLTKKTAGLILLFALPAVLVACGQLPGGLPAPTAATIAANMALACDIDQQLQPVAATTVGALVPGATTVLALTIDQLLVHPAVVAYCKARGGTPAVVTLPPPVDPPAAVPPAPAAVAPATAPQALRWQLREGDAALVALLLGVGTSPRPYRLATTF